MRVDRSASGEERDALASDWAACMAGNLPETAWLPIPNLGAETSRFLLQWGVDAILLSGGNDVGSCPVRDETERAVCEFSLRYRLPVLGVCRVLHFLLSFHGGRLKTLPKAHAESRSHPVQARHPRAASLLGSPSVWVNSFHRMGVSIEDLVVFFEPWMVSPDGVVEAMVHKRDRHMAVQWHPERPLPDPELARRLFRFFQNEL